VNPTAFSQAGASAALIMNRTLAAADWPRKEPLKCAMILRAVDDERLTTICEPE
jgi:hypothetical protein